jgi:hypothetical protein
MDAVINQTNTEANLLSLRDLSRDPKKMPQTATALTTYTMLFPMHIYLLIKFNL